MNNNQTIICPNCQQQIDVNEVLYAQLENEAKKKTQADMKAYAEKVDKAAEEKINKEKTELEKKIKEKIEIENSAEIELMKKELQEQTEKVKELNRSKAEIEKLKREKDGLREEIELEKQKELTEILNKEKEKIERNTEDSFQLKIKELEKKLEDQTKLAIEMKKKMEQGSMQLQGDVQESLLKEILIGLFPGDEISDIKTGAKGADIVQIVRTNNGEACGKIYYESKRTERFSEEWISKLKQDNTVEKADILVIATKAMPQNSKLSFFIKDGVWICSFNMLKEFSIVLRESLINLKSVELSQVGKDQKMEMLYNYLTSNIFKNQFDLIITNFQDLRIELENEKKKMEKIWAQREKKLDIILTNSVRFYGTLKGIAGASIPDNEFLEDNELLLEEANK